ncbi:MAG: hypothetical protein LBG12_02600, partial [Synergistaceae bacterium]|nr:hypothetical protein [Synergistaceae bacterium]
MPNESLYFEMYQYDMILVNCLGLIQKWNPETMTLSVFVESAGIDGKFPDFRKEGGAYTYGSRLVRVDEITDKDVAMFTLLSVKGTIIFTFAVSDLWDKPPCVTFQSY